MPEIVGVNQISIKVLNGGGFVVETSYADDFKTSKACDSVGKMRKRLKEALSEMIDDVQQPKGK